MPIYEDIVVEQRPLDSEVDDAISQSFFELQGDPECFETVISDQDREVKKLISIRNNVKHINQSKTKLFSVMKWSGENYRIKATVQGSSLTNLMATDFNSIRKAFVNHTLNPNFELYEKLAKSITDGVKNVSKYSFDEEKANRIAKGLNLIVRKIQRATQRQVHARSAADFERRAFKNYASTIRYLRACSKRRSNLLNIRLDLGFRATNLKGWSTAEREFLVTPMEIRGYRQLFQKHLHRRFGEALIGFVWKLEFGPERGYHIHYLIMLDASLHQQDVLIGKLLGEYWKSVITDGRGSYFNCNAQKERYKYCAIGRVQTGNPDVLLGLHYIACYITLADVFVHLDLPNGDRSFGKGNTPKTSEKSVGRPRKQPEPIFISRPIKNKWFRAKGLM